MKFHSAYKHTNHGRFQHQARFSRPSSKQTHLSLESFALQNIDIEPFENTIVTKQENINDLKWEQDKSIWRKRAIIKLPGSSLE